MFLLKSKQLQIDLLFVFESCFYFYNIRTPTPNPLANGELY